MGAHIWDLLAAAECRLFPAWICFLADLGRTQGTEPCGDELITSSDFRSPTFVTTADNVPVARIAQHATLPAISSTRVMAAAMILSADEFLRGVETSGCALKITLSLCLGGTGWSPKMYVSTLLGLCKAAAMV